MTATESEAGQAPRADSGSPKQHGPLESVPSPASAPFAQRVIQATALEWQCPAAWLFEDLPTEKRDDE